MWCKATYYRSALTGLLAIGVAGWAIQANAAAITILNGATSYTFTGTGGGGTPPDAVTIATVGFSGQAIDTINSPSIGTYTFGAMTTTTASVSAGGNFNVPGPNNTESFSYTAPDGDNLSGTATWTLVRDSTLSPDMVGVLNYTVGAGSDAAFQAAFGKIGVPETSQSFNTTVDVLIALDTLASGGGSRTSIVSSGQVVPSVPSAIPLPSAIYLFGSVLAGAFWIHRRKRSAV